MRITFSFLLIILVGASPYVLTASSIYTPEFLLVNDANIVTTNSDAGVTFRQDTKPLTIEWKALRIFDRPVEVGEKIGGEVVLPAELDQLDHLTIPSGQNMFSIEFSVVGGDDHLRYIYRLDQNDEWQEAQGPVGKATYINTDPGEYLFQVRAMYNEGSADGLERTLTVNIAAPWWGTWTARIAIIAVILAIAYFLMEWRFRFNDKLNRKLSTVINEKTNEINRQNHQIIEKNRALQALNEDLEKNLAEKQNVLKKLEETQDQLIESEKMASLGVLTAGLAHELNNPLNIIGGVVDPVKDDLHDLKKFLNDNPDALPIIDEIEQLLDHVADGAGKATQVIKNLMGISPKSNEDQLSMIDLKELISTTSLLIKKGNPSIEFTEELEPDMMMEGNPVEISQVLINMIRNSIDAIGDREKGLISIKGYMKSKEIFIEIADNGEGISPDMKLQIFDPFFTTKEPGKGTGLGLYLSMSILKKHSGQILVDSSPGEGTTFTLVIPAFSTTN